MENPYLKADEEKKTSSNQNYAYTYQVDMSIETGVNNNDVDSSRSQNLHQPYVYPVEQQPGGHFSQFVHNLAYGSAPAPQIFAYTNIPQQNVLQIDDRYKIQSRYPVITKCTSCGTIGQTKVTLTPGYMTYGTLIFQLMCCIFSSCLCFFIGLWPLLWNELKDSIHSCQSCGAVIAKVERHNTGYPPQNPYNLPQQPEKMLLDGRQYFVHKVPFLVKCNHCHRQGMTITKKNYGLLNFLVAGFLSPLCCFIPFQSDCCKDTVHFCSTCGNVVANKMDQTITFLNTTEGRDKFCKVIQYGSRFIMWHQLGKNDKLSGNFKGLFEGMRDARKLFRLFKSLMEYQKIQQLLKQKGPQHKQALNILSRLGFLFYWIFDNIQILSKVKYLDSFDKEKAGKRAAFFWLLALFFNLLLVLIQIYETSLEEAELRQRKRQVSGDEKSLADLAQRQLALNRKKVDNILNLLKTLGDMVTASQALGLPKKIFGFDFNDGHVGLGGLTSAAITCYQLFPSAPKK